MRTPHWGGCDIALWAAALLQIDFRIKMSIYSKRIDDHRVFSFQRLFSLNQSTPKKMFRGRLNETWNGIFLWFNFDFFLILRMAPSLFAVKFYFIAQKSFMCVIFNFIQLIFNRMLSAIYVSFVNSKRPISPRLLFILNVLSFAASLSLFPIKLIQHEISYTFLNG